MQPDSNVRRLGAPVSRPDSTVAEAAELIAGVPSPSLGAHGEFAWKRRVKDLNTIPEEFSNLRHDGNAHLAVGEPGR